MLAGERGRIRSIPRMAVKCAVECFEQVELIQIANVV